MTSRLRWRIHRIESSARGLRRDLTGVQRKRRGLPPLGRVQMRPIQIGKQRLDVDVGVEELRDRVDHPPVVLAQRPRALWLLRVLEAEAAPLLCRHRLERGVLRQEPIHALSRPGRGHVQAEVVPALGEAVEAAGRHFVEDGTEHRHPLRLKVARAQVEGVDCIADARLANDENWRTARDGDVGGGAPDDRADGRVPYTVNDGEALAFGDARDGSDALGEW
mmetsp:Transcript_58705/g.134655  ORF Transcript_58705/g.134655 Transcript_58705/m.134655 type:complete len:221 (-) Transcript_58705:300-962(-)